MGLTYTRYLVSSIPDERNEYPYAAALPTTYYPLLRPEAAYSSSTVLK